jgi:hypothetical protein
MNDPTERSLARTLDPYAQALRTLKPSASLDERMDSAITSWAQQSARRSVLRRPLPWVVTAASVAAITGGLALLLSREGPASDDTKPMVLAVQPQPPSRVADAVASREGSAGGGRMSPLAMGQVSLYPAESAIFRVKASFASTSSVPQTGEVAGERQYWVDVRIASDGTMRIVQVLPAERGRVVPRE